MTDDDRNARIETLADAIADTNRAVAGLSDHAERVDRQLERVDRQVDRVVLGIETLADVVQLHLQNDHGYPRPTEDC